jgi:NAD(P)-dependent dehydrogenase (short-subunit alcohol dehydrogenase family)
MFKLTDKVVFLTGCGSVGPGWGNGKSIAVLFARQAYGKTAMLQAAE